MKRILVIIFCLFHVICVFSQVNPNYNWVEGYTRSDGTKVRGHYRTNPNSTNRDNYSTLGNVNPWTGEAGTILPDNKPLINNNIYEDVFSSSSSTYDPSINYKSSDWSSDYNNINDILLKQKRQNSNIDRFTNKRSSNWSSDYGDVNDILLKQKRYNSNIDDYFIEYKGKKISFDELPRIMEKEFEDLKYENLFEENFYDDIGNEVDISLSDYENNNSSFEVHDLPKIQDNTISNSTVSQNNIDSYEYSSSTSDDSSYLLFPIIFISYIIIGIIAIVKAN